MGDIARVREKVESILAREFQVELEPEQTYGIRYGSARVLIDLECNPELDDARVLINLSAPLVFDLEPSPELFEYVATHSVDYYFGHIVATRMDDGTVMVSSHHTLLGDYLDDDELITAIIDVLVSADIADDEIRDRFGGERYFEES